MPGGIAKQAILVVDDEPVNLALVAELLAGEYHVLPGATDGYEGLARTRSERPDIVLTDIAMPGLSGYELCRSIKKDPGTRAIPVIFMSGVIDLEDHLAGHDAGGEDFLPKPFRAAELRYKVANALRVVDERRRFATDASDAFRAAMTAMSSAAELGVVLNFMRNSFACENYDELADMLVDACAEFGLEACVRLRGQAATLSKNRSGPSSALEAGVLERLAEFGRIVDFGRRSTVNCDRVTLMVTDLPIDDPRRNGRLRDHLVHLAEAADAWVHILDKQQAHEAKGRALADLVGSARRSFEAIDRRHRENRRDVMMIMHGLIATMEQSFSHLDLSEDQEDFILGTLRRSVQSVMDLFSQGLSIDDHLQEIARLMVDHGEGEHLADLQ